MKESIRDVFARMKKHIISDEEAAANEKQQQATREETKLKEYLAEIGETVSVEIIDDVLETDGFLRLRIGRQRRRWLEVNYISCILSQEQAESLTFQLDYFISGKSKHSCDGEGLRRDK